MIPQRGPGESFESHKRAMADWMGAETVAEMDAIHDPLHASLCAFLGLPSFALQDAAGEPMTPWQRKLASMEEEAILHCQRLIHHAGASVPQPENL